MPGLAAIQPEAHACIVHGSQTEFHWMQGSTYGEGLLYTHPLVSIEDAEHANQAASPQAQFWVESHRIIRSMKQR